LSPEEFALGAQRGMRSVFAQAAFVRASNPGECKPPRPLVLALTAGEIIEAAEAMVMLAHANQAQRDQFM